jgi:hypothetical protein
MRITATVSGASVAIAATLRPMPGWKDTLARFLANGPPAGPTRAADQAQAAPQPDPDAERSEGASGGASTPEERPRQGEPPSGADPG